MQKKDLSGALGRAVLGRLSPDERALLGGTRPRKPSDYDGVLEKLRTSLPALDREVSRNRARVRDRYQSFGSLPAERRKTLVENSPPSMLLALVFGLMDQSYTERFSSPRRSLELATLAIEVLPSLARTDYLSPEVLMDVEGESLIRLGNAQRLNSHLLSAERTLARAADVLRSGTGDRPLRADLFRHLAILRTDQGRSAEAGELIDREIAIRRLLGDRERLGEALINRGVVSQWFEPLETTCSYLRAGAEAVENPITMLLALFPLAETLARTGEGLQAWKVTCQIDAGLILAGAPELRVRNRAIQGIALRVLGELADAERELLRVCRDYGAQGREIQEATALLDLAAVHAARGRSSEAGRVAKRAHEVLLRQGVQGETVRALQALGVAVEEGRLTERLVVHVANFVVQSMRDRALRFDEPAALSR